MERKEQSIAEGSTVCFFARVPDRQQIEVIEFYAQDVAFLRDLGYHVRSATRIRELFQRRPADFYFCWWWTWAFVPVALAKLLKRPAIITGTFNHHLYASRPLQQRKLMAWAARNADANVFVSELERREVTSMISVTRPTVSPHTVDPTVYHPPDESTARDPNLLVSVVHLDGGNSIRKCATESIRALALLGKTQPGLRLVLAGQRGDAYPHLAQLANDLGIGERVSFPGSITREEKIRLMQRCAIYLQPSRFEGFGLAVLEAMACGAPVVTSAVGAMSEVGGETVLYVNGESPEAIAGTVRDLLHDDSRRRSIGRAARERAVIHFAPQRRRGDLADVLLSIGLHPDSPSPEKEN
jgi:glycosyltransferase involved in cell wall biosynthesis